VAERDAITWYPIHLYFFLIYSGFSSLRAIFYMNREGKKVRLLTDSDVKNAVENGYELYASDREDTPTGLIFSF